MFHTKVSIDVTCVHDTDKIWLNANELTIESAHLTVNQQNWNAKAWNIEKEVAHFSFDSLLKAGQNATLHLEFKGILNDKMNGFYRSNYTDTKTGEKKVMAVTQFEATVNHLDLK